MSRIAALLPIVCLSLTVLTGFQAPPTPLVSLDAKDVDVRDALRMIMRQIKTSYTIDPSIQGRYTGSFTNLPVGNALDRVLKTASATYRIDGGIYEFVPRVAVVTNATDGLNIVDTEIADALRKFSSARSIVIAPGVSGPVTLIGPMDETQALMEAARQVDAMVVRTDDVIRIVPKNSLRVKIDQLSVVDKDLRALVVQLLDETGVNYVVSSGVAGKTTAKLRDMDVQTALEAILSPIGGKITLRKGVFVISVR